MVKVCTKCLVTKSLKDFYKNKNHKDGLGYFCGECQRAVSSLAIKKSKMKSRIRVARNAKPWTEEDKRKRAIYKKLWRAKHKDRLSAHNKVQRAKRAGQLISEACKICHHPDTQAHHCDYSKPLEVMWLCSRHHAAWHNIFLVEEVV